MPAMHPSGGGHPLPPHVRVREDGSDYVVELDVADFTADEVAVETVGLVVTVRAEQEESAGDRQLPFRLHERLVESFRLPDDAHAAELVAIYKHGALELRVPRSPLEPRRVPITSVDPGRLHPDAAPI